MNETPVEALGPPPFRFTPSGPGGAVEGPAFSPFFKLLTVLLVGGITGWFGQLWLNGKVTGGAVSILTWFLAALAMMAYTSWWIYRSRTYLDARELRQTWVWEKKMALGELAYCKLVRVRGFEWLIAPRLYARTLTGKFAVFYAAAPQMVAEFERLVVELKAFRGL